MKKIVPIIALVLLCGLAARAQSDERTVDRFGKVKVFEYERECGSPVYESMIWFSVEGRAVRVVDGDSIVILTSDGKRKRVDLTAVDASASDSAARRGLRALVLNREMEVLVSPSEMQSRRVTGQAHVLGKDINRELISSGLAKYKKPRSYSLSSYVACTSKLIEGQAREARRGLWSGAGSN